MDQQGTHSYSYDSLYRLTSVTYPGPSTTSYAFDAFGNRTSKTDAGGTASGWPATSTTFSSFNRRQPFHATGRLLPPSRCQTATPPNRSP